MSLAHFRGLDQLGNNKFLYAKVNAVVLPGPVYTNYWTEDLTTDWKFSDLPDIAVCHLDAASTLGLLSLRIEFSYHGYEDDFGSFVLPATDRTFDHTFNPGEFYIIMANSTQRTQYGIDDSEADLRRHCAVVGGLGNYGTERPVGGGINRLVDDACPLLFFPHSVDGIFLDGSDIKIGNNAPQTLPAAISVNTPPGTPDPWTSAVEDYWQLGRYRTRLYPTLYFFDPHAGPFLTEPADGTTSGDTLALDLGLSTTPWWSLGMASWDWPYTTTGHWAAGPRHPHRKGGADWSLTVTLRRV